MTKIQSIYFEPNSFGPKLNRPVEQLGEEQGQGRNQEPPGPRGVEDEEDKVGPVEQVGEVEDLEVAASADDRGRAEGHDGQDGDQGHSRGVGNAHDKPEHT